MTRKKKKHPQSPDQGLLHLAETTAASVSDTCTTAMREPVAALQVVEGGPLENGRIWVAGESMVSADMKPGDLMLLSSGGRSEKKKDPKQNISSFAPNNLSPELFSKQPPQNLMKMWGVEEGGKESVTGMFCIGCEVWPNAKLKKGDVQLSQCLATSLGSPAPGCVVYLHSVTSPKIELCTSIQLRYLCCVSTVGEERKQWMESMLEEPGVTQTHVLKTSILLQIHKRLMLKDNIIPVLLMGCSVLFRVTQMHASGNEIEMATVDGDQTNVELDFVAANQTSSPMDANESELLKKVREIVEQETEGSHREVASKAAVEAARSGLRAMERSNLDDVVLSELLRQSLQSLVISPLTTPSIFSSMGLTPPRGVILHGPPGSGKTMCASWAARTSGATLFVIDGPSLVSEYYGGTESGLVGVFDAAKALSPSLIFLDEIDTIAPSRGSNSRSLADQSAQDSSIRLVTTLLSQFDALQGSSVVVLAATNRLASIDEALRRPGRFDREIEIGTPSPDLRLTLFKCYFDKISHSLTHDQIADLAFSAHGFLPADIAAFCREASLCALRRWVIHKGPLSVLREDVHKAENYVRPSGLRELQIEVPRVKWEDIGGLDDVKQQLRESVEWPIRHAASLKRMGISAPKGILLFGPPGCSKTLLAKAVATETGMNFVSVTGSEMLSMYVGESEKAIGRLFARARLVVPCIVFVDEVDGLMGHRDSTADDGTAVGQRMLSQLLVEMDGIRERGQIVVIGATNKPQLIDSAMLRPGRFDRLILVPPPDCEARRAIFDIQFRNMCVSEDVDSGELAGRTTQYTGADIVSVCREAGVCALEEDLDVSAIGMKHFLHAIENTTPSIGDDVVEHREVYEKFRRGHV